MSARKLILLGDYGTVGKSYKGMFGDRGPFGEGIPIHGPVFDTRPISSRDETTDEALTPDIMKEINYRVEPLIKSTMKCPKVATMSLEFTDVDTRVSKVCVTRNSSNTTGFSNLSAPTSTSTVSNRKYSLDKVVISWRLFFEEYKDSGISEESIKDMEVLILSTTQIIRLTPRELQMSVH